MCLDTPEASLAQYRNLKLQSRNSALLVHEYPECGVHVDSRWEDNEIGL
jgi:hypothetical protein